MIPMLLKWRGWPIRRESKWPADIFVAAAFGTIALMAIGLWLQSGIPRRGHVNLSIRPDEVWPMRLYFASNFAWTSLWGAIVIALIRSVFRRFGTAAGASVLSAVLIALSFPVFMGQHRVLEAWRGWLLLGDVVFIAAFSYGLFRWAVPLAAGMGRRKGVIAVLALFACGLFCLLFWLLGNPDIKRYPFVVYAVFLGLQLTGLVLSFVVFRAKPRTARPLQWAYRVAWGIIVLLAALDATGYMDGAHTARIRRLIKWQCPGVSTVCDLAESAKYELMKSKRAFSPDSRKAGFIRARDVAERFAPQRKYHVVLFVADALRRDYVGFFGNEAVRTPNLDRLARESRVYLDAFSPAPGTGQSMTSILTGLLPGILSQLEKVPLFLPTYLRRYGYRSASSFSAVQMQMNTYAVMYGIKLRDLGIYGHGRTPKGTPAEIDHQRMSAVIRRLKDAKQPRFEYIHLVATHGPFKGKAGRRKYQDAIAQVDKQLGRLVSALKAADQLDKSILLVIGDHGEGLGEHGIFAHAQALYADQTAVPLIIRTPGGDAGVVKEPTTISVIPTLVMEILGGEWPFGVARDGVLAGMNKNFAVQEMTISDDMAWRCIRFPPLSYHRKFVEGEVELYDMTKDPGELTDLSGTRGDAVRRFKDLEKQIVEWETSTAAALSR